MNNNNNLIIMLGSSDRHKKMAPSYHYVHYTPRLPLRSSEHAHLQVNMIQNHGLTSVYYIVISN